jgi:hypothetical protein
MVSSKPKKFQFENFDSAEINFQESMIFEHNRIREANGQYPLKIDTFLSLLAFNWAEALSYRNKIEYCKDLNVDRACGFINFENISTELKQIYKLNSIAQNLIFLPYTPVNYAFACKQITKKWFSNESISYVKQENDWSSVQAFTFQQLQANCDFAGFGYSKSPINDYFYVVAFYHPFIH